MGGRSGGKETRLGSGGKLGVGKNRKGRMSMKRRKEREEKMVKNGSEGIMGA